jgi:tripartite-type tricarboxylate transporter receptor subunit TctC
VWAQAWPGRPVRIIVPFQPDGSTDIFARLAAQKLTACERGSSGLFG